LASVVEAGSPGAVVIGAGGIGCAIGHALRSGGVDVTFVEADERKVAWGRSHGVRIEGRPTRPARFVRFDDWRARGDETIFLCTKCYDNRAVLDRLGSGAEVVPVQNGFDRQLDGRVSVEGIASFVSECEDDRPVTRITRAGRLHIGPRGGGAELPSELDGLVGVLEREAPFAVTRTVDVLPYKYAKLMYNAAISPLAAVTGVDNAALLTHRRARALFFALLRENYGILKRAGVPLGRVGPFHPDTVDRILRRPLVARAMAGPFSRTLRNTYCSMSGDIEKGRTEIENFNGHLVELAGGRGCGLNETVLGLVNRMAAARSVPELDRLAEIAA
jgi:2-dehydropantoate 2-reductase